MVKVLYFQVVVTLVAKIRSVTGTNVVYSQRWNPAKPESLVFSTIKSVIPPTKIVFSLEIANLTILLSDPFSNENGCSFPYKNRQFYDQKNEKCIKK